VSRVRERVRERGAYVYEREVELYVTHISPDLGFRL
jgi:hypothetical protein